MKISLEGIESAISGLNYRNPNTAKARLIRAIQSFYQGPDSIDAVKHIDNDELIDRVWDLGGDVAAIKSKRKNLSSIKSSVNTDLNKGWKAGNNPEGITIGPRNTFEMSNEAKDSFLSSFSGAMDMDGIEGNITMDKVAEALHIVTDYLSQLSNEKELNELSSLKSLVQGLASRIAQGGDGTGFELSEKKGMGDGDNIGDSEAALDDGAGDGEDGDSLGKEAIETEDEDEYEELEVEEDAEDLETALEVGDEDEGDGAGEDGEGLEALAEEEIEEEAFEAEDEDEYEELEVEEDAEDLETALEAGGEGGGDGAGEDGDDLEGVAEEEIEEEAFEAEDEDEYEELEVEEDAEDLETVPEAGGEGGGDGAGEDGEGLEARGGGGCRGPGNGPGSRWRGRR